MASQRCIKRRSVTFLPGAVKHRRARRRVASKKPAREDPGGRLEARGFERARTPLKDVVCWLLV
jgi:hypothetical protein